MFPRMFHLINCEKTETLTRFYRLPVLLGGGKVSPLKREQRKARTKKEAKAVPGGSSPPLTDRQQPDCFMVMEPPPHQPAATQSRGHPHFGRVLPSEEPGEGFWGKGSGTSSCIPAGMRPAWAPNPLLAAKWHQSHGHPSLSMARWDRGGFMGSGGQNEAGKEQPGPMGCCTS